MRMSSIEVPEYVSDDFNKPLSNTYRPDNSVDKSLERAYRLIAHALAEIYFPEWQVNEGQYCSSSCNEPIGFHRVGDKFYIYAEERGRRDALAIFKSCYLAADYFVWLVSKGKKVIDWSLLQEMEP